MSDARRVLSPAAVDLLSVIAETPEAEIAGAVLDHYGTVAAQLLNLGVLIPEGHETTTTSLADHDDVPVTVTWSAEHGAFGYFSATAGWVTVPADRLAMYRVAFDKLLRQLVASLFSSKRITLTSLLPNLLWEVGDVKVPGRGKRVPLWIGRRLADPKVWSRFAETVRARPAPGLRIVLSLTPADRLPAQALQGHSIISVHDIVDHARGLVVDPDLLAARIEQSGSPSSGALITMAAEGAAITVGRKHYKFSGSKQRSIIRQLYGAWQTGSPECLTVKILEDAGNSDSVNTLGKAFSGREDWRDFIKEERGRCWMFA